MSSQCFKGTKPSKRHDTYSKKKQIRNKQKILLDRSADRRRRRLDEYIRTANSHGMLPNFGVTIVCLIVTIYIYFHTLLKEDSEA